MNITSSNQNYLCIYVIYTVVEKLVRDRGGFVNIDMLFSFNVGR